MERELIKMRQFALRKAQQGWSGNKIAEELHIPRRTAYAWLVKYRSCEEAQLANHPTRVKIPVETKTRKEIIRLREKWNWGPNKIEGYIRAQKPHGIDPIGHKKIHALLVEEDLNRPIDYVRTTWGTRRFCRLHSNSLWQTDFKLLDNDNWICTYLDDHSRFILRGKEFTDNPTGEIALEILKKATTHYGVPEAILTDQGTEFYCAPAKGKDHGISTYTQTLLEWGISHIVASKRRPTTIGKIEAFHKGVQYEAPDIGLTFKNYIPYWNNRRPHQELHYQYPREVYFKDFKKKED